MAYLGGSAFAMARDIGEGYILLSAASLKKLSSEELQQLRFELEKILTSTRGDQPTAAELSALQARNRKISRLNSALSLLKQQLQIRR